jgi:hypothetical protein
VVDHATLHSLLRKVRDEGLPFIALIQVSIKKEYVLCPKYRRSGSTYCGQNDDDDE